MGALQLDVVVTDAVQLGMLKDAAGGYGACLPVSEGHAWPSDVLMALGTCKQRLQVLASAPTLETGKCGMLGNATVEGPAALCWCAMAEDQPLVDRSSWMFGKHVPGSCFFGLMQLQFQVLLMLVRSRAAVSTAACAACLSCCGQGYISSWIGLQTGHYMCCFDCFVVQMIQMLVMLPASSGRLQDSTLQSAFCRCVFMCDCSIVLAAGTLNACLCCCLCRCSTLPLLPQVLCISDGSS